MDPTQLPLLPDEGERVLTRHSTLDEAVLPFLEHLRQEGRSQHTIKAFASDLRLAEFFGAGMALNDFTTTKLSRFMAWIETGRGVPCSRKTYARRVTTLKVFFKHLKETDVLPFDPADALLQRSGAAPLQPALTDEQVDRLLEQTALLRLADDPDARSAAAPAAGYRHQKKRVHAPDSCRRDPRGSRQSDPGRAPQAAE
jgi:site-specific recombinase XerD